MRRSFLEAHAIAYDPTVRLGEDYVLYVQCLLRGARLRLVSKCGYVAVTRETSLSGLHTTRDLSAFLQADRALLDKADLDADTRQALAAHIRQVKRNYDYREMLDARRAGDFKGLLARMLRNPDSALDAVRLALRSRLRASA